MAKLKKEEIQISKKNTEMKHSKITGMIVGACTPFASNAWYQEELINFINMSEQGK